MTKKKNAKQRREEREAAKKEKWRNARQQNVESKQSDCNTQPPIADISENTIAPKQKSKKTKVKAPAKKTATTKKATTAKKTNKK